MNWRKRLNTRFGMCIWGVMSIATVIFMGKRTNFKAIQIQEQSKRENFVYMKYDWNSKSVAVMLFVVILSLCNGYIAALKAVSDIAWLELSIAYVCLLSAAMIDYKLHIIPNVIAFLLIGSRGIVLLFEIISGTFLFINLADSILGCMLCFLMLMATDKLFPGGIGKGDIKLLSALGFLCGVYAVFSTLLLSLFCCVMVSIILLLMKKVSLKEYLPFGPFIWLGYMCMILFAY